ncbi:MAG: serine hydrolase domain-containing protein [Planctomycetota bacterium]
MLVTASVARELPRVDPAKVGLDAKKIARIDRAVQAFIDKGQVAGAITLVARRGKIAHFSALGKSDIKNNRPMRRDTIVTMYSMTKPITTAAAMILWERGRIDLDAPVARYLPRFEGLRVYQEGGEPVEPRRPPTVRDLMRHTSGLTYGFFDDHPVDKLYLEAELTGKVSADAYLDAVTQLPLKAHPGELWDYSISTDVLGRLVAKVSEQTLAAFFHENIFDPLDMSDTGYTVPEHKLDRLSAIHGMDDDDKLIGEVDRETALTEPGWHPGGHGLYSTARDYLRFCQMLLNEGELHGTRILKAQTVRLMGANHVDPAVLPIGIGSERPGQGFGLGFSVVIDPHESNPGAVRHEIGWGGAASTHFWISPDDDLVVIALQQFRPYTFKLEHTIKPLVYGAITD